MMTFQSDIVLQSDCQKANWHVFRTGECLVMVVSSQAKSLSSVCSMSVHSISAALEPKCSPNAGFRELGSLSRRRTRQAVDRDPRVWGAKWWRSAAAHASGCGARSSVCRESAFSFFQRVSLVYFLLHARVVLPSCLLFLLTFLSASLESVPFADVVLKLASRTARGFRFADHSQQM